MNSVSLKFMIRNALNSAAFAIGMLPLSLAHGFAIPKDDEPSTVQDKRSTTLLSSWLYFSDQSKNLLFIGTQSCPGPSNPQIAGIQAVIKTFKPTVAVVDESSWPIATLKNADNTTMRRYSAFPNDHDFIQQILIRLREGKRVLVITTANRLREVKPLLAKGLAAPAPPHAFAAITPTRRQFACVQVVGRRLKTEATV